MHRYHNSLGESVQACHNLLFSPVSLLASSCELERIINNKAIGTVRLINNIHFEILFKGSDS